MQKLFSVLTLFLCFSPFVWGNQAACTDAYRKLNQLIERNFFETRRTFEKYIELFPAAFSDDISRLDSSGHWLDAGSGEAFAVQDFFKPVPIDADGFLKNMQRSTWKPREIKVNPDQVRETAKRLSSTSPIHRPQVTAVTFSMERSDPQLERLEIKSGKLFEQIPISEFKPADIITDLFGVSAYSPQIDEVLRRYHQILKPGGKAYLFLGDYVESPQLVGFRRPEPVGKPGWDSAFVQSEVITKSGKKTSLLDWVRNLPGFGAEVLDRKVEGRSQPGMRPALILRSSLVLEKNADVAEIPSLKLIQTTEDKPPIRLFEEISLSD